MRILRNLKIGPDTERLIEKQRRSDRDLLRYANINKEVKKSIKQTEDPVTQVIENNSKMKVLRFNLSKGKLKIHKMKNYPEEITAEKGKIIEIILNF